MKTNLNKISLAVGCTTNHLEEVHLEATIVQMQKIKKFITLLLVVFQSKSYRAFCCHTYDLDFVSPTNNNISTYYTSPDVVANLDWFLDSRTINHVTTDLLNLQQKMEYGGFEEPIVGSGQGLTITNTSSFTTKHLTKIFN